MVQWHLDFESSFVIMDIANDIETLSCHHISRRDSYLLIYFLIAGACAPANQEMLSRSGIVTSGSSK